MFQKPQCSAEQRHHRCRGRGGAFKTNKSSIQEAASGSISESSRKSCAVSTKGRRSIKARAAATGTSNKVLSITCDLNSSIQGDSSLHELLVKDRALSRCSRSSTSQEKDLQVARKARLEPSVPRSCQEVAMIVRQSCMRYSSLHELWHHIQEGSREYTFRLSGTKACFHKSSEELRLQDGDGDKDFEEALTLVNNNGLNSTLANLYSTPSARSEGPSQNYEEAGQQKGIQAHACHSRFQKRDFCHMSSRRV